MFLAFRQFRLQRGDQLGQLINPPLRRINRCLGRSFRRLLAALRLFKRNPFRVHFMQLGFNLRLACVAGAGQPFTVQRPFTGQHIGQLLLTGRGRSLQIRQRLLRCSQIPLRPDQRAHRIIHPAGNHLAGRTIRGDELGLIGETD